MEWPLKRLSIHHDSVPDKFLEKWEFEGEEHGFSDRISAAVADAVESFCTGRRPRTPTNAASRDGEVSKQATAPAEVVPVRAIKQR